MCPDGPVSEVSGSSRIVREVSSEGKIQAYYMCGNLYQTTGNQNTIVLIVLYNFA